MIYATEQQVVVTAVLIVAVGLIAMFLGRWWGIGQGREQGYEEREREERKEARARRTHPVYRWHVLSECPDEDACPVHGRNKPPEVAHERVYLSDGPSLVELDAYGGYRDEMVANGQAVTTGEIQAITDEMDAWLAVHVYSAPADYGAWLEREGR